MYCIVVYLYSMYYILVYLLAFTAFRYISKACTVSLYIFKACSVFGISWHYCLNYEKHSCMNKVRVKFCWRKYMKYLQHNNFCFQITHSLSSLSILKFIWRQYRETYLSIQMLLLRKMHFQNKLLKIDVISK